MRHAARVRMPLTAADCALAEILELMAYMHRPRQSRALCEMWRCVVCVWLPWATIGHAAEPLASQDRPPNVVLLISDDQRSDTIHAWGNPQIRTPHLDRLVSSGCSFLVRRLQKIWPSDFSRKQFRGMLPSCNPGQHLNAVTPPPPPQIRGGSPLFK